MAHSQFWPKQKINLSTYRSTINEFLPFVLVRCSKYTNCRRLAEIVAAYAFICAYKLTQVLDGANKMSVLLDIMVGVVGEDGSTKLTTGLPNRGSLRKLLFKWEDDLLFAKQLAEMKVEECLREIKRHPDLIARNIEPEQFDSITETVMEYLVEEALMRENRHRSTDNG